MSDFTIKRNDLRPVLERTLKDSSGNVVDLTNTSVDFHMRAAGNEELKVDSAATVTDATGGIVEYRWSSGDTDTTGVYESEFEVTFADGTPETFPNSEYITVTIHDDIA